MSEREKSSLSEQMNKGECFRKTSHPQTPDEGQGWEKTEVNDTLNTFDRGVSGRQRWLFTTTTDPTQGLRNVPILLVRSIQTTEQAVITCL